MMHACSPRWLQTALLSAALLAATAAGAGEYPADGGETGQRLRAHIEFLADDLLGGRQPGTPGYDIAANYVASQFRQLGLLPAGDPGSYLQQVPLRRAMQVENSALMGYDGPGGRRDFQFVEEFFIGPSLAHESSEVVADLAFVGYGIQAPELEHDDYAAIDVRGKIVVIMAGQPHDFPSEEGAHFSSTREKTRAAVAAGAVGLVQLFTPRSEQRFSWSRLKGIVGTPSMGWVDENGQVAEAPKEIQVGAIIHHEPAAVLFEGADLPLEELLALDEAAEPLPVFDLPGRLALFQRSTHEAIASPNVAGFLPGNDPTLSREFVVYTAHLDHVGTLPGEGHDDPINNGALDNAAGIGVMIETARAYTQREAPRRSVLFLAVTAEEKGLVGADYFAQNPTLGEGEMVGVVNLDMPMLLYDFADVIAFGADHSSLGALVAQAAGEYDTELTPDPAPERNIFVRSDHYRFVQAGIPSIFLVTGIRDRTGEVDVPAIQGAFLQDHYHQPGDDPSLPIRYDAGARFVDINVRIGELMANDPERPRWHEGDFFGETFSP